MSHTAELIKKHWGALALALLVGFLTVLPSLSARVLYDIPFSSPTNIRLDDEFLYAARIREVIDDHLRIGNPYLWEEKGKPPAPLFVNEWIVGFPLEWLGVSVVAGGVLYDFLLPLCAALLAYACFWRITRLRWLSVLGTAALFTGLFADEIGRAVSPQLNVLFWLGQMLLFFLLLEKEGNTREWRWLIVLNALAFGALFYIYTYYATFAAAFIGLVWLGLALRREYAALRAVGGVFIGGILLAVPYAILMYGAYHLPEYAESVRRIGIITTHMPSGIAIVLPAIAMLALAAWCIRRGIIQLNAIAIGMLAGPLAGIVSVNQHVITGQNLEFSSHYLLVSWFSTAFLCAHLVAHVWGNFPRTHVLIRIGAGILSLVLLVCTAARIPEAIAAPEPEKRALERYTPALEWIETNTEPDVVICAPPQLSGIIPIYTAANVCFSNSARLFFVSDRELVDRFILNFWNQTIDEAFVRANERALFGVYYIDLAGHIRQGNILRRLLGFSEKPIPTLPEDRVRAVVDRAEELHKKSYMSLLQQYGTDYLIWDSIINPDAQYDEMPFLVRAADIQGIRIYRVD